MVNEDAFVPVLVFNVDCDLLDSKCDQKNFSLPIIIVGVH